MDNATGISPASLASQLGSFPPPQLIDVRRQGAVDRDPVVLASAIRRTPERVAQWSQTLEPWRRVVVYCVHGHEVSQEAATALRASGYAAAHLDGGLEGWRAAGGTLFPLSTPRRAGSRASVRRSTASHARG